MIVVEKNTSIEDIDNWINSHEKLHFSLKAESSFQIFSESYAISTLRQLKEDSKEIIVTITDSSVITQLLGDQGIEEGEHPILTIFGLQLMYSSDHIFLKSDLGIDIRERLAKAVWRYILGSGMRVGSGRKVQYISNHTNPVPISFGGERKSKRYAEYQKFKAEISKRIVEVWKETSGISEDHLKKIAGITFHAAENAYDHGRSHSGKRIRGYYGITIEKMFFDNREQILDRSNLPLLLKNYFTENFNDLNLGAQKKMRAQIISVSDIGGGIQNTLQLDESLNDVELICKAFDDLVTSKPQRMDDEQPGFGLGDIVSLSRELGALIYVQSGEYELYYDFSDDGLRMTDEQKRKVDLIQIGKRKKRYGVNLSLVWILQSDKIQPELF